MTYLSKKRKDTPFAAETNRNGRAAKCPDSVIAKPRKGLWQSVTAAKETDSHASVRTNVIKLTIMKMGFLKRRLIFYIIGVDKRKNLCGALSQHYEFEM